MNIKKIGIIVVLCVAVFTLAGSITASADNITKIELYPASIEYGQPILMPTLYGTTNGKNNVIIDLNEVSWSSSNPKVAVVTTDGMVFFTGNRGNAVLTATYGKLKATMKAVTEFKLVMGEIYFSTQEQQLNADAINTKGSLIYGDYQWSCSNPEVATIDSKQGTITFSGKKGTATIKVSFGGVSTSRTIIVTPKLEITNFSFTTGSAVTLLHASASYGESGEIDITDQAVWSSSNKNVAEIGTDGKSISYTGKPGITRITCSYGGVSISKSVSVDASFIIPEEFWYDDQPISLSVIANYGMKQLQTIPTDSIVWKTSNKAVATVDQNGVVSFTGKVGAVKITATVFGRYVTSVETFVQPEFYLN